MDHFRFCLGIFFICWIKLSYESIITAPFNMSQKVELKSIFDEASLTNCASVNPTAILLNGSLVPNVIRIPGHSVVNAEVTFTKNLPVDMQLKLHLIKLPSLPIPCLSVAPPLPIGSCTYDLCDIISTYPGFCKLILPPELGCECPLSHGDFKLQQFQLNVPALDQWLARLMVGDYIGEATLFSKSDPDWTIGCLEFRFSLAL